MISNALSTSLNHNGYGAFPSCLWNNTINTAFIYWRESQFQSRQANSFWRIQWSIPLYGRFARRDFSSVFATEERSGRPKLYNLISEAQMRSDRIRSDVISQRKLRLASPSLRRRKSGRTLSRVALATVAEVKKNCRFHWPFSTMLNEVSSQSSLKYFF